MPNIDQHVQHALHEGNFDNLPGQRKPPIIEDYPFIEQDQRLAYHLLSTSGYTLPWVAMRNEIVTQIMGASESLQAVWKWKQDAPTSEETTSIVNGEWKKAIRSFIARCARLNKQIKDFNLQAPAARFHLPILDAQKKITTINWEKSALMGGDS